MSKVKVAGKSTIRSNPLWKRKPAEHDTELRPAPLNVKVFLESKTPVGGMIARPTSKRKPKRREKIRTMFDYWGNWGADLCV